MSGSEGRVALLIVGSLYWDDACHRRTWRRDRLDQYGGRYVRVPIRYGRLSSRRQSYTMVFSRSLGADDYGRAIVVPCSQRVRRVSDVVDEAVHLWTAETSDGKNEECRVSAESGWGGVALLPNPQRPMPADLRAGWSERISGESGYCKQLLEMDNDEDIAVNRSGFLRISWPEAEDGSRLVDVDLLLAAATAPTTENGCYPAVQKIADAWNSCDEGGNYFWRNREHGITTFQDADIRARFQTGKPRA